MAESLASSKSLRAGLRAANKPDRWDELKYSVQAGYPPQHVQSYCVHNAEWQRVRLSMKGKDTYEKIQILEAWWDKQLAEALRLLGGNSAGEARGNALKWATEVQVGNYLGALRRGGQLDDDNLIRKAR